LLSFGLQKLGAECGHGDVHEIALEGLFVSEVVKSIIDEGRPGDLSSLSPSLNDDLRMNFGVDELFGLSEEFSRKNCDGGRAITNLLILSPGDIY